MESPTPTYGSDTHGLIWAYSFVPGQSAQLLAAAELAEHLSVPHDTFLWLHLSLANAASERWLRHNLTLPDAFYDSLHEDIGSTRLEQESEALVAVVHDVLFDVDFDASAVSTVHLCIQPHLLVSARLRPLQSIEQLRASVKAGQAFSSSAELLAHLLRAQADVLVDIVRKSTTRVNRIEDQLLNNRITIRRSELGTLRRMLVRLQRLLAPEPTAFFRLLSRPPNWIGAEELEDLRQAAEEFSAALGDSAALIERIKLLQEELAALVNEQTNRTLFVLTMVTVLALPINLVAGLFGMNVGGIPLAQHGQGFFTIIGVLAAFTTLLAYLVFGRRHD